MYSVNVCVQEATRGHPKILNLTRGLPRLTESQRPGFPRVPLYKMCRSFVARQVARIVTSCNTVFGTCRLFLADLLNKTAFHKSRMSVNYDRSGECSPEKDCL